MGQQINQPKQNFQLMLDQIIETNKKTGRVPSLLLHSCCGPCSSYVVTYLMEYFRVTVFYYNPNIYPETEYEHRLREQEKLLRELKIPLLEGPYEHDAFLHCANGLEGEPEGGGRCRNCFLLRLEKTRETAALKGFDYFCTTLTVSPHKNAVVINEVGKELQGADSSGILWLPSDFKKRDGYKKSIALSRQYDLYRQDYCGCEFSLHADGSAVKREPPANM